MTACGRPTLAEELLGQIGSVPEWIVVGAGTGATATTIGRHLRAARMLADGRRGAVVTLIADAGDVPDAGHDLAPHTLTLERLLATGTRPAS